MTEILTILKLLKEIITLKKLPPFKAVIITAILVGSYFSYRFIVKPMLINIDQISTIVEQQKDIEEKQISIENRLQTMANENADTAAITIIRQVQGDIESIKFYQAKIRSEQRIIREEMEKQYPAIIQRFKDVEAGIDALNTEKKNSGLNLQTLYK